MEQKPIKIAFVGCLHGRLADIYSELIEKEIKENIKIDIVICCGDFQSVRTEQDLDYMSVPDKYKEIGQFYLYYTGQLKAPFLTIFIGGNHEASNVLDEYHYGGYLCENIFYLGRSGVVNYKGLRIAGLSGIYKEFDYFKGHFEFNLLKNKKSVYHNREFEVAKLSQITGIVDVLIAHDWPNKIVKKCDINDICRIKPHFRKDLQNNDLGSPATQYLLEHLKPRHFVCAHMHYSYQTIVKHENGYYTKFTSLDKIKKRRTYMLVVDIFKNTDNIQNDNNLYFDSEWLAITKNFNDYIVFENKSYDFSAFIKNNDLYFQHIKKSLNQKTYILKDKHFEEKFKEYKDNFVETFKNKENGIWKHKSSEENRNYIISVLDMFDSFKYKIVKKQKIINNKEEISIFI